MINHFAIQSALRCQHINSHVSCHLCLLIPLVYHVHSHRYLRFCRVSGRSGPLQEGAMLDDERVPLCLRKLVGFFLSKSILSNGRLTLRPNVEINCNGYFLTERIFCSTGNENVIVDVQCASQQGKWRILANVRSSETIEARSVFHCD